MREGCFIKQQAPKINTCREESWASHLPPTQHEQKQPYRLLIHPKVLVPPTIGWRLASRKSFCRRERKKGAFTGVKRNLNLPGRKLGGRGKSTWAKKRDKALTKRKFIFHYNLWCVFFMLVERSTKECYSRAFPGKKERLDARFIIAEKLPNLHPPEQGWRWTKRITIRPGKLLPYGVSRRGES